MSQYSLHRPKRDFEGAHAEIEQPATRYSQPLAALYPFRLFCLRMIECRARGEACRRRLNAQRSSSPLCHCHFSAWIVVWPSPFTTSRRASASHTHNDLGHLLTRDTTDTVPCFGGAESRGWERNTSGQKCPAEYADIVPAIAWACCATLA